MAPNNIKEALLEKLEHKKATIGVIGLGYVGLPLVLRFSEVFSSVIGFDVDADKVTKLNDGESYIRQIQGERIQSAIERGLKATVEFSKINICDIIIICVPTPLTKHFEPDLSFVRTTTEAIAPYFKEGQLLALESTTFPGTTEELIAPRVENRGFTIGKDFFLSYSPEREDPGNADYNTQKIPKVVGGFTKDCLEIACKTYNAIIDKIVPVSSTKTAEMTKLLENIHRAVNIGLVNEMKIVADKMGIDIHEVIDAAATKPFGFTKFSPGPGLGGHCIPIDPFYLTWKAKEYGVNTRFIELAGEINRYMPQWVVQKTMDALNEKSIPLKNSRILMLGIAYKKNVDDTRESPAIEILSQLAKKGARVDYSDPYVPKFPRKREYSFELTSIKLNNQTLNRYDCAILVTDHDGVDYTTILNNSKLIIDTRGRLPSAPNVIKA